jgi:hypothetical protein
VNISDSASSHVLIGSGLSGRMWAYAVVTQGSNAVTNGSNPKDKGLSLAAVELLRKVERADTPLRGCLVGRRFTRTHVAKYGVGVLLY